MQVRSLGREDPRRRARRPTPVFLPGESHGQSSLAGYSPKGRRELDTTEAAYHAHMHEEYYAEWCLYEQVSDPLKIH